MSNFTGVLPVGELSLENPFSPENAEDDSVKDSPEQLYDQMLARGEELLKKPLHWRR
jgi:hypothetical protein